MVMLVGNGIGNSRLYEADYVSICFNSIGKGKNPPVLHSSAMDKLVRQTIPKALLRQPVKKENFKPVLFA